MQHEQDGLSLSTSPFPNELSHQDSQSLPGSQLPDRNLNIYTEIPDPNAYIFFGSHDHSNSHVDYALSPRNDTLADTGTYNDLYSQPDQHIIEHSPAQVVNDVNPMANGSSDHGDISYTSTNDSRSGLTFPYAHRSSQPPNSGFPSHFDGSIGQSFSHQQSSIQLNLFESDNNMTRSMVQKPREQAPLDIPLLSRVSHLTPQQPPEKGRKLAHGASHGKSSGTDQARERRARKDRDSVRKGKNHTELQSFRIAKRKPSKKPALNGNQYPHHKTVAACSLWLSQNSGKMPSEHEMSCLSVCFGSSIEPIRNWFKRNVTGSMEDEDTGYQTMRASTADIASLYRGNRGCERKATSIGVRAVTSVQIPRNESRPLACTSRCPRTFKEKGDWKRHEEKNRVQRLWICDFQECRNKEGRKRVWLNRKEHFRKHLSSHHPGLKPSSQDIENCYVQLELNFDKHCIFSSCDHIFQSWMERIDHIGEHFKRRWEMSEWRDMDEEEKDTDATDAREDESGDSESDDPDDESASDDTQDGASGHGPSNSSHDRGADQHGGHPGPSAQRPGSNSHHNRSRDGASTALFQYNCRIYGCQANPSVLDISIRSLREPFLKSRNLCSGSSQAWSRLPTRTQTVTRPFVAAQSMQIHALRVLGRGSSAIVDEVKMQGCEATFARKQMLSRTRNQKRNIHREVIIMARLNHPHVIHFFGSYQRMNSINYILGPVADCNLLQYLSGQYSGPEYRCEVEGWFSCLASGLQYLHHSGVRHRDIKPSNMLLSNSRILYSDFGSSNMIPDDDSWESESADFTERYAAPEVFSGHRGRAADVFALGCVFTEIFTLYKRERTYHNNLLLSDAREQYMSTSNINRGQATTMPPSGTDMSTVQAQCKAMTESRPEQRPTAAEIARQIPARVCCEEGIPREAVLPERTKWLTPMAFDETADSPGAMPLLFNSSDDGTLSDISCSTVQSYEIFGPTRSHAVSQDTGPTTKAGSSSLYIGANTYCLPSYNGHSTALELFRKEHDPLQEFLVLGKSRIGGMRRSCIQRSLDDARVVE